MLLSQQRCIWIHGKYSRDVRRLFADVDVHWDYPTGSRITFSAEKALPNFYSTPHADQGPVEDNPIYILVPNKTVTGVWAGSSKPDEVRYGTAQRHQDRTTLTPAIGIFKGQALLYICLNPLDEAGVESLEVGSLGM